MFRGHDRRYHHRHPSFADTGAGVVIAAEFRKMCRPRNPVTTTPTRNATTIAATTTIATRFPRPILSFLTIWSIARSLSMSQSDALIVPMQWPDYHRPRRFCAIVPNWVQAGFVRLRSRVVPEEAIHR